MPIGYVVRLDLCIYILTILVLCNSLYKGLLSMNNTHIFHNSLFLNYFHFITLSALGSTLELIFFPNPKTKTEALGPASAATAAAAAAAANVTFWPSAPVVSSHPIKHSSFLRYVYLTTLKLFKVQ